jgi:hypothetical protein
MSGVAYRCDAASTSVRASVNAEGRVIVANHADHVTGSQIRTSTVRGTRPVPDSPWSLVPLSQP